MVEGAGKVVLANLLPYSPGVKEGMLEKGLLEEGSRGPAQNAETNAQTSHRKSSRVACLLT